MDLKIFADLCADCAGGAQWHVFSQGPEIPVASPADGHIWCTTFDFTLQGWDLNHVNVLQTTEGQTVSPQPYE